MVQAFADRTLAGTGGLELVGVRAVIQDLSKYLAGAKAVEGANTRMAASATKTATASQAASASVTKSATATSTALAGVAASGALAGAAIVALSTRAAIRFETSFANVRKTVDATEEEFARLSDGIREMATRIPAGADAIADVTALAGQLGIENDNLLEFTETMIGLGTATNLSATEAADALARLANITGLPQDQIDNLASSIVDLGNNTATTEKEILEFAVRIAGAGEIAGLAEADITGISAAFSAVGVEAEAGGTAIQKVLIAMTEAVATANDDLAVFAETAGLTAEGFQRLFEQDPAEAFVRFVEGLQAAGTDAFAILEELSLQDQRLVRSFLSIAGAGDLLRESVDLSNEAFRENTALAEEVARRNETTAAQLQIFANTVQDLAISLGFVLLPALNAIIGPLADVGRLAADAVRELKDLGDIDLGLGFSTGDLGNIFGQGFLDTLPGASQIRDAQGFLDLIAAGSGANPVADARAAQAKEEAEAFKATAEAHSGYIASAEASAAATESFGITLGQAADTTGEAEEATSRLASAMEDAELVAAVLEDGIVDIFEAGELGLSAFEAGALEAQTVLSEAGQKAFDFNKELGKVAGLLDQSREAAEKYVGVLAEEARLKADQALGAILGEPTQQEAELLAELARQELALIQAGGPTSSASSGGSSRASSGERSLLEAARAFNELSDSQRAARSDEAYRLADALGVRLYEDFSLALRDSPLSEIAANTNPDLLRRARAFNELSDEERAARASEAYALADALGVVLFEDFSLALKNSPLADIATNTENLSSAKDAEAIERNIEILKENLEERAAERDVLGAEAKANDPSLLTDEEQRRAADQAAGQIAEAGQRVRDFADGDLSILVPELAAATEANKLLSDSMRVLTDDAFRDNLFPAAKDAAEALRDVAGREGPQGYGDENTFAATGEARDPREIAIAFVDEAFAGAAEEFNADLVEAGAAFASQAFEGAEVPLEEAAVEVAEDVKATGTAFADAGNEASVDVKNAGNEAARGIELAGHAAARALDKVERDLRKFNVGPGGYRPPTPEQGYQLGGIVRRRTVADLAEDNRPEVVLPLTRPGRSREILGSLPPDLVRDLLPASVFRDFLSAERATARGGARNIDGSLPPALVAAVAAAGGQQRGGAGAGLSVTFQVQESPDNQRLALHRAVDDYFENRSSAATRGGASTSAGFGLIGVG